MSRHIIRFPLAALIGAILMTMACCTHRSAAWPMLSAADSLMESRPDSALAILRSVDPSALPSGEESARYALLMSMALDKNYVDTTTFDILQPAIDYYLRKGTPDERLRTLYYQGRIYQNRRENDKALSALTQAVETSGNYKDSLFMAHALYTRANIYNSGHDNKNALESYLSSGNIYHSLDRKDFEFDCLLNALNSSVLLKDKSQADSIMEICMKFRPMEDDMYRRLQGYRLSYFVNMRDTADLRDFLTCEIGNIGYDMDDIVMLANAYNSLGEHQKALQLLDYVERSGEKYDRMKHLGTAVFVNRDLGDYRAAFNNYWNFNHVTESILVSQFEQKTALVRNQYEAEKHAYNYKKQKTLILWKSLFFAALLLLIIFILGWIAYKNRTGRELATQHAKTIEMKNEKLKAEKQKKELEAKLLEHRIHDLEDDIANLKRILQTPDNIPHDMQAVIRNRLEMLNEIMARYIASNDGTAEELLDKKLKELTEDTEQFMKTNRLSFQASHPQFIKFLVDHHLTESEINYVCLYAIGLQGKEVGKFIGRAGHINTSSIIRGKLGLKKHETYLSIYVRRLLQKS